MAYDGRKAYQIIERKGAIIKPRKGAKISPSAKGPPTNKLKGVDISPEDELLAEYRENLAYIA